MLGIILRFARGASAASDLGANARYRRGSDRPCDLAGGRVRFSAGRSPPPPCAGRAARRHRCRDRRHLDHSLTHVALRQVRQHRSGVRQLAGELGDLRLRFPAAAGLRRRDHQRRSPDARGRRSDPDARRGRDGRHHRRGRRGAMAGLRPAAGGLPSSRLGRGDDRPGRRHRGLPRCRRPGASDPARRGRIPLERRRGDRDVRGAARHDRLRAPARHRRRRGAIRRLLPRRGRAGRSWPGGFFCSSFPGPATIGWPKQR